MTAGTSRALTKRPLLTVALLVLAGFGLETGLKLVTPDPGRRLSLTPVVAQVLHDPGSPAAGARPGDVTVVVFTDVQCPICKRDEPALGRLLQTDPGVRVVYKDWPIRGELSEAGARTALAAAYQGRYRDVHEALMAARGALTPERIAAIAAQAGAEPRRLAADLAAHGPDIERQLAGHNLQAFSLGLSGTPAYLVGPYLLEGGLSDRRLARAVDRARAAGPPKPP